jgi:hypothetical protein
MNHQATETMQRLIAAVKADDVNRLRSLTMDERAAMLEAACKAAAVLLRSRAEAGLPPSRPAPWPASTWEFQKRHAARVRA